MKVAGQTDPITPLENLLDRSLHLLRGDLWAKAFDDAAIAINKEFREVPEQLARCCQLWCSPGADIHSLPQRLYHA
jgi:hypothetical protein